MCWFAAGVSCQRADVWQAQWHPLAKLWYSWFQSRSGSTNNTMIILIQSIQEKTVIATILGVLMSISIVFLWWFRRLKKEWEEESSSGKVQQHAELSCAGHVELTVHAGINKCTGVTADHVKKHLGAVCVPIYAGIFVFVCRRPHPHDHHKIRPFNPSYMWV